MLGWPTILTPEVQLHITENPIQSFVRNFRDAFIKSFGNPGGNGGSVKVFEDDVEGDDEPEQEDNPTEDWLDLVESFLLSLHTNFDAKIMFNGFLSFLASSQVANSLMANNRTLASILFEFLHKLNAADAHDLSLWKWKPLLCHIVAEEPLDVTVWRLVTEIFQPALAPPQSAAVPTSSAVARLQTPVKLNSAVTVGESGETHAIIDRYLRAELDGLIFPGVPGVIETFFENDWSEAARGIYEKLPTSTVSNAGWSRWPASCAQDDVIHWFTECVNPILALTGSSRLFGFSSRNPLANTASKLQPDIFIRDWSDSPHSPTWSDILVVGELKQSRKNPHAPVLVVELANYVRQIFIEQHYRRFVHAFTLCADDMRCWIFHRGGGFSSCHFSVNWYPMRFLSAVAGYALMTPAELGFDPTIAAQPSRCLTLTCPLPDGRIQPLLLEAEPFFTTSAIASRGTTCWNAKFEGDSEFNYIVKDAWRPASYVSEGILLAEAQEAGVKGLVQYVAHQDVQIEGVGTDTTIAIARGLKFVKKPINLRPADIFTGCNSYQSGDVSLRAKSAAELARSTTKPKPPRRPSQFSLEPLPSVRKRTIDKIEDDDYDAPGNSSSTSSSTASSSSLLSKNGPFSGNPSPALGNQLESRKRRKVAAQLRPVELNRVHTRLVTIKGKSITNFNNNLELLYALRDGIRGHWSLLDLNILHRDISTNNIMIALPSNPRSDGFKGFLIDLDLAIRLNTLGTTSNHRTGTIEFMAIGVMDGELHTYRHDLESFFYVFLWICVHVLPCGKRAPIPNTNIFTRWATSRWEDASDIKLANMDTNRFETHVLIHFNRNARRLKKLALGLREALFPTRGGGMFIGTDPDPGPLYRKMIACFDHAIDKLERRAEKESKFKGDGS